MTQAKTPLRMTAQRKLDVYRKTRDANAPIGEILREYGLHLDDLRRIEGTVESAALAALKVNGSHHKLVSVGDVTNERVAQLEQEIREKTEALAEMSMAFITLEKKDRLSSSPLRVGRLIRQKSVNLP